MKIKQVAFEIKNVSEEGGTFEGYANTFNFKDKVGDNTQQGAFSKSLQQHKQDGSMPALLWQHKQDQPIGVWTEMYEDEKGLYAKGKLTLGVQQADEAYLLLKAGALRGLSIGYNVEVESYDRQSNTNFVKEVILHETSLVTFPCNTQSQVEVVKSKLEHDETPTEREFEKALRELGLSRKQAKAFMTLGFKSLDEPVEVISEETKEPQETDLLNNNVIKEEKAQELLALLKTL
uniref:HK97 family phage prohead protease n=1 Tax=Shewanella sp. TaxID=50422 RepID=UPI004048E950